MKVGDYEFVTDTVAKFFGTMRLGGWFHHPDDALEKLRIHDEQLRDLMAAEIPRWAEVVKTSGATVE